MAKPFNSNIDLGKSEIQNARLQNLPSNPTGGTFVGLMYYSTATLQPLWWDGTNWKNVATDSALLGGNLPTYFTNRANHTGTQLSSTISDFSSAAQTLINATRLDQLSAPTTSVNFNGQRQTNVASPLSGTDGVNRNYVDGKIAGLSWKDEVQAMTTANVVIASGLVAGTVIDGYTLVLGDRVFVGYNTTGSENGFYDVPASGAATRSYDATTGAQIDGAAWFVQNGTANGGKRFVLNNTGVITVGTTALTFAQFGAGAVYTNGNGIALTSNVFSFLPKTGGGILVDGTGAYLDPAVAVKKYAMLFGDTSTVSYPITHGLNTLDVTYRVVIVATGQEVGVDSVSTSVNVLTINVTTPPGANAYRITVHG